MAKKTYVLDTSVCLTDASCLNKYQNNDIVIPLKVLEEIDKHKKRQDSVGANARSIIRSFDSLRLKGNLQKGVRIGKGKGILKVASSDATLLPEDLDPLIADHLIISTALSEHHENSGRKTILVSRASTMASRQSLLTTKSLINFTMEKKCIWKKHRLYIQINL